MNQEPARPAPKNPNATNGILPDAASGIEGSPGEKSPSKCPHPDVASGIAPRSIRRYNARMQNTTSTVPVTRLGVDEGNHAEMPAIMAGGLRPGQLTRVFERDVRRGGEVVRQVWKVMGTEQYGLPSNTDADVYYALMDLSDEQGWPRRVSFSLYDLIERMRWDHSGTSYRNARESLKRWATVRIEATNSFYVLKDREYRGTLVWGFIDEALVPPRQEVGDRSTPANHVTWNEHFLQSVRDGYVFAIDLDLFCRLRQRPLARRLYSYLNKKFGAKNTFTIELKKLAHQHLGIAASRSSPAQIRALLDPAAELLRQEGYLCATSYRAKRRSVIVTFHRAPRGVEAPRDSVPQLAREREPTQWLQEQLFGPWGGAPKKALQETGREFLAVHGWEEWESFASFVRDYRRDHWPELNSLGGAMTLLTRFLETREERVEQRRAESARAREQKWNAYIDEQIERLREELPDRIAQFEAELRNDRDYCFWSEAAQGLHTTGSSANRPRHAEAARKILRTKFATSFRDRGIKPLAEWLDPTPASDQQPRLPL